MTADCPHLIPAAECRVCPLSGPIADALDALADGLRALRPGQDHVPTPAGDGVWPRVPFVDGSLPGAERLTARQLEVMRLLASGYTSEEVADELGINDRTMRNHRTLAYRRLGATNLVEALTALGWLRVPAA